MNIMISTKPVLLIFTMVVAIQVCYAQTESFKYLNQSPPQDTPKVFLSGKAERIAISNDNKEIYYTDTDGISYFNYSNGDWHGPIKLIKNYGCPSLSTDGTTMYIQDNAPEAWYLARSSSGWSKPYKFWNNPRTKHYLQFTTAGNYYLTYDLAGPIRGNISKIPANNNADTIVQSLEPPINSDDNGVDFFVSKDESYIIFVRHPGGTNGDLYLSFRKENSHWTTPAKLNSLINSACWEWGPYVTNDNKYLFFTRGCPGHAASIYWVRIDRIIDTLRSQILGLKSKQ